MMLTVGLFFATIIKKKKFVDFKEALIRAFYQLARPEAGLGRPGPTMARKTTTDRRSGEALLAKRLNYC